MHSASLQMCPHTFSENDSVGGGSEASLGVFVTPGLPIRVVHILILASGMEVALDRP